MSKLNLLKKHAPAKNQNDEIHILPLYSQDLE